ncbi:hypothetical protein ACSNOH_20280 [Streptomyces sp. URMC 127]|uniref:hypothetical protein n=1 Tax=Streptomyces sp. URMC 127 TaxID=3423402 RepID=UPI003F1CD449
MEYAAPTAGLIIAAVLFVIGVLSVNDLAARDFKITISGKVGPFQRGVLVAAAALCLVLSVAGFYLLTSRSSGSDSPPSPPAREMTLKLTTSMPQDEEVVQQTDVVTVGGAQVTLSVNSGNPDVSDVIHFEGDPGDMAYKVDITFILKNGESRTVSGSGTIFVDNGLTYKVDVEGDPLQAVLKKAA